MLVVNAVLPSGRLLESSISRQRHVISERQLVVLAGQLDAAAKFLDSTFTNSGMPRSTFPQQIVGRVVHQVEVAHLIGGRRADDGDGVLPRRVEGAPGKEEVAPGDHHLALGPWVEGLRPLGIPLRKGRPGALLTVVAVAADHRPQRVGVHAVGEDGDRVAVEDAVHVEV